MKNTSVIISLLAVLSVGLAATLAIERYGTYSRQLPRASVDPSDVIAEVGPIRSLDNGRWVGSLRFDKGTIYYRGHLKSTDGARTVVSHHDTDVEDLVRDPGLATISSDGTFYAAGGDARPMGNGVYRIGAWRSTNQMRTLEREDSLVYVPEGPTRARNGEEWYGLFVHRNIVELPQGPWLMTMYGQFAADTLPPQDRDAARETTYMTRAFVVTSVDKGRSWRYLSSIAVPKAGDPVGEGFGEPTVALLSDGRLLAIMRSGHHYPLYASWSSDGGTSWTPPVYTGLDRGCDPSLIRLQDGRLALSWGRRYPEGWSTIGPASDQSRFKYPGQGYTNLAVSDDGGRTWINRIVARDTGSGYSTIFEVEPNVIAFQVDSWYWRVTLRPKGTGHA